MRGKIVTIVVILLLGAIGFFAYRSLGNVRYDSGKSQLVEETNTSKSASPPAQNVQKPNSADECITTLSEDLNKNKTEYERGSILVSFAAGTSIGTANATLSKYSFTINSAGANNFSTQAWGSVKVPPGDELIAICKLRADADIKFAGINPILKLHE